MGKLAVLSVLFFAPQDRTASFAEQIDGAVASIQSNYPVVSPVPISDLEFIFRVSHDMTGEAPKDEMVRAFEVDPGPKKREKLVDDLLASPRFGTFWGRRLAEAFIGDPEKARMEKIIGITPPGARKIVDRYVAWLSDQLQKDRPYVEIVREMIEAKGKSDDVPALGYKLAFFRGWGYPEEFAMAASRGLLGVRLYCARCHDHPFDRWTVENYYGLAAFVVREKAERAGADDQVELRTDPSGELEIPSSPFESLKDAKVKLASTGRAAPVFLFGGAAGKDDDRGKILAQLATSKANTPLPRALVNRVWGALFRRGVVHPVDDFNLRNKAASPVLLDALTRGFVASGYSLKTLLREICRTKIYQVADAKGPADHDLFYLRGIYRKEAPERKPPVLPAFTRPVEWEPETRLLGWPWFRYRVPDKDKKSPAAKLYVAKSPTPVERAFGQTVGAKPRIEKIQGKQEIELGEATGTFYCDLLEGAPIENDRTIYARLKNGWTFRLEGPADTVGDWRDQLIEILKSIDP